MSYVAFASEHAEVELRGTERHHAGLIVRDITLGLLNAMHYGDALMARAVNVPDYVAASYQKYRRSEPGSGPVFAEDFTTAFTSGIEDPPLRFRLDGKSATARQVQLNTAIVVGNDVTRLLAFLEAQCELHGWIAEANRGWYADIIDQGRDSGVLRANVRWEEVAALLRNGDGGPVVTSYSVTESFPNRWVVDWRPLGVDEDDDTAMEEAWEDLSDAERWALGVAALDPNAEWSPVRHPVPDFGGGLTVFDIVAPFTDTERDPVGWPR